MGSKVLKGPEKVADYVANYQNNPQALAELNQQYIESQGMIKGTLEWTKYILDMEKKVANA